MIAIRRPRPLGREEFLRGVQAAKRAAQAGDVSAPLRFAAYIDTLSAYTDGDTMEPAPRFTLSPDQSRAVDRIHTAATRTAGGISASQLTELAHALADQHQMRPGDVLRMDVREVATLIA